MLRSGPAGERGDTRRPAGPRRVTEVDRRRLRAISTAAVALLTAAALLAVLLPEGGAAALLRVAAYAGLGAAVAVRYAAGDAARATPTRTLAMVFFTLWILAGASELAQAPLPGREPALRDWALNMAAALVGLAATGPLARLLLGRARARRG